MGEEILDLLCKPTVKERSTAERFRSQGGKLLMRRARILRSRRCHPSHSRHHGSQCDSRLKKFHTHAC